jgi:hypothetical protein
MQTKWIVLALSLPACGDDPWPGVWANGEHFAECVAPLAAPDCAPTGRSFALAVCGDLTADNTLTVGGAQADVALWVRDDALTHAPLRVAGNFASGSNTATNTQAVGGNSLVDAPAPSCAAMTPATQRNPRWDVVIDRPAEVVLEGCSYAQPSLEVNNTLEVHIRSDVTWFIDHDLHIAAPLNITVEPGAHLRWTIAGSLAVDNTLTVEGPTTLTVGGPIHIAAPFDLDGSLIAPNSRVDADNTVTISGAAYVGTLHIAAPMRVDGETLLREDACTQEPTR